MAQGDVRKHYSGIYKDIGGQFLLDPNEFNGWGPIGPYDDTNTQDLGNVGAEPSYIAGGFSFPFDVKIKQFRATHRNSNANAQAWGWRIFYQVNTENSSSRTNTDIYRECTGDGATAIAPNNYGNNLIQYTDVNLDVTIPAGAIVCLGVESPTANTTNYYVQIKSGWFYFQRA